MNYAAEESLHLGIIDVNAFARIVAELFERGLCVDEVLTKGAGHADASRVPFFFGQMPRGRGLGFKPDRTLRAFIAVPALVFDLNRAATNYRRYV